MPYEFTPHLDLSEAEKSRLIDLHIDLHARYRVIELLWERPVDDFEKAVSIEKVILSKAIEGQTEPAVIPVTARMLEKVRG
jgi:hypothetical protein